MATSVNLVPMSGLNWIDALLDDGPNWNFVTSAGNTLLYTFSVNSGNEVGQTGQVAFTASQQAATVNALGYLESITGIHFAPTNDGAAAQLHFSNIDITLSSRTTGLCDWYSYSDPNKPGSYLSTAYIYLDNNEFYAQNSNLAPGTAGYQTLLHELGHAMGLKHPFEGTIVLPSSQDDTANTLMSYTDDGGPYQAYSQYDIAALNWLYGGDGLAGTYGVNSDGGARFITGTNGDDTLDGNSGNEKIDGAGGTNTVVFSGVRSAYTITTSADGSIQVTGGNLNGSDILSNIQILTFSDTTVHRADIVTLLPPTLSVTKNANGYALGSTPIVTGSAEVGATVKLYVGSTVVGSTVVDSTGLWSIATTPFKDGMNYALFATATDAAGNISPNSGAVNFNIDATPPIIPTGDMALAANANNPAFSGTGEVGTTIQLVNVSNATEIARTTVVASGTWYIPASVLPNGSYSVSVVSLDAADNATSSSNRISFTINSPANMTGDAGNNVFTATTSNSGIDGGGGMDTVKFNEPRANFTVAQQVYGYSVVDKTGVLGSDTLVNIERLQFSDGKAVALDVSGNAGQVYRMYQAALDRTPDPSGYAYWLDAMDHGMSLSQVSSLVLANPEAVNLYMSDPSDSYFITQLYHHVLHRDPDAAGLSWWLSNVEKSTRADVLVMFSESPENQAQVIGTIQNGIDYTPWTHT